MPVVTIICLVLAVALAILISAGVNITQKALNIIVQVEIILLIVGGSAYFASLLR